MPRSNAQEESSACSSVHPCAPGEARRSLDSRDPRQRSLCRPSRAGGPAVRTRGGGWCSTSPLARWRRSATVTCSTWDVARRWSPPRQHILQRWKRRAAVPAPPVSAVDFFSSPAAVSLHLSGRGRKFRRGWWKYHWPVRNEHVQVRLSRDPARRTCRPPVWAARNKRTSRTDAGAGRYRAAQGLEHRRRQFPR